jgi:hypothetical protein
MTNHPHLKSLHTLFTAEVQPFRKVHRMIDLFESIIKSHTVVILAEYVKCNDLSDTAKGMLSQGLRTPSLGTWQLFSRVLFEELEVKEYQWTIDSFVDEFKYLDKALNNDKTNVIAFRNGYAHGATPSDEQCEKDIERFEPFLNLLLSSKWLEQSSTHVMDGLVYLKSETDSLCLHPILLHREENSDASFAFFNDLKNDKIGLLNYPLGKHYREKEFFKEFHNYLPLNEWKKSGNNEFYQRIEELTETFKGRTAERESLLQFVLNKSKGYCSIQGNPGIGKSALIAKFFKDLRGSKEASSVQVVEYFIRRGTAQAQTEYLLNYLIKRTDEVFPQGKEVRAEGKMVFDLQQQLFSKWRLWSEHSNGKKLLFLIDGLDEGVENNVVSYLPRENFEDVLIIYGSRPGGHKTIDELWATLPIENHTKIELSGLSKEDIRALIYEVANKYDLERESEWIEVVQQRSQGNPLYLKLLCDSLENKAISLNDVNALPTKIDEYYKAILLRYAQDPDGDALLAGLYTFAAAKDYLTLSHLGLINQLGDAVLERIGSTLKEVLYENPLTEDVLDYQLFHESFREYLVKEKALKVNEASYRIIDFCSSWKDLQGQWEQRYTLEHYATHLYESKKEIHTEQLLKLIYDSEFQTTQKKVLRGFEASNALFRLALLKASEVQRFDEQLEAGLCLVDLKYEEANDAPQIVAMVANGEIDLALKRIESFGGSDKEGVQRKFTLYMLCLMELTLLDSKDKSFRKEGIEKLLNHLDEQIPADTSLINWNDFFPSYVMFQMACEWVELGIDYLILYKRTDEWEKDWLTEKAPFSSLQFEVLLECACTIISMGAKISALTDISAELAKQGKVDEALACVRRISSDRAEISALTAISTELAKKGRMEEAAFTMRDALACARRISDESIKSDVLKIISVELVKQCQDEEALSVLLEALSSSRLISSYPAKCWAFSTISTELYKQRLEDEAKSTMQEAFVCVQSCLQDWQRCDALKDISVELAKQGKIEEALACSQRIEMEGIKSFAIMDIAINLAKQGLVDRALLCAESIRTSLHRNEAYVMISAELAENGFFVKANSCVFKISDEASKSRALCVISKKLAQRGRLDEAFSQLQKSFVIAFGITQYSRSAVLKEISEEQAKQGLIEKASVTLFQSIVSGRGKISEFEKGNSLVVISRTMASQSRQFEAAAILNVARECALGDLNTIGAIEAVILILSISTELAKQGKIEEAILHLEGDYPPDLAWLFKQMNEGPRIEIAIALAKRGKLEEAYSVASSIKYQKNKSAALVVISSEHAKQGYMELSKNSQQEALDCARGIQDEWERCNALTEISSELAKNNKKQEAVYLLQEALSLAKVMTPSWSKCMTISKISTHMLQLGYEEASATALKESFDCAREIGNEADKCSALNDISTQLAMQGNWSLAETIGLEILQFAERHNCWKTIAQKSYLEMDWQKSLKQNTQFKSDEARLFYLKGWANSLSECDADLDCVQEALKQLAHDSESIENLLQKHALYEVFFGKSGPEKINRLNQTVDIQWALDIAAQFPKAKTESRLSTNLESWLHEIADEDDREQIELWAKQVAKGKISEEEFGVRVREL